MFVQMSVKRSVAAARCDAWAAASMFNTLCILMSYRLQQVQTHHRCAVFAAQTVNFLAISASFCKQRYVCLAWLA
jgi:hypothetical protein